MLEIFFKNRAQFTWSTKERSVLNYFQPGFCFYRTKLSLQFSEFAKLIMYILTLSFKVHQYVHSTFGYEVISRTNILSAARYEI